MTNNNRDRVIRIEKGQTLWVVCPPLQPFRVFFDSKLNDLAIAECEPQDVPTIEENAPPVPDAETEQLRAEYSDDGIPWHPLPGTVADVKPSAAEKMLEPIVDKAIDIAIEQGLITPTFPDRFNKPTSEQHVETIAETLGPVAQLYKHEKQVLGATVTAYTHDPASPYDRKVESITVNGEKHDLENPPVLKPGDSINVEVTNTAPQNDLFGQQLQSDIPFFNEPSQ